MRTITTPVIAIAFILALIPASTVAQEKPEAPAAKAEEKEKPAAVATAPAPVIDDTEDVIYERLVGLYFEGRVGAFFTVGGARGFSNGEPFFGFELGYDFTERFSAQFGYASGFQSNNPVKHSLNDPCRGDPANICNQYHLDYGLTFFNLSADYDVWYGERWALEVRAGGGLVLIDPSAKPNQGTVDFDVFGGLRYEYYTMLKHFSVGAEYDFYYVLPTGIPAMSISAQIMYNF